MKELKLEVGKRYVRNDGFTVRTIIKKTGADPNALYWDERDQAYLVNGILADRAELFPNHIFNLRREDKIEKS